MEQRPLIIVGSGPAGTATAIALHRLDPALARETLILEKGRHPRPKVCAGGLIPAGRRWMAEHDISLTVPYVAVHRARVTTANTAVEHEDRDLCAIIRRAELDALLVDAARRRGVAVGEDEPVVALEPDASGVRVTTPRATYHAPLVIGADGAGSLVRRRLVDADRRQIARAIMVDVPLAATRWDGFGAARYDFDFRLLGRGLKGYLWAFPCLIDGVAHANVGAYALHPSGAALDAALDDFLLELGAASGRRVAFPIHWYAPGTRVASDGAWLVGDAAGVDALMGEGISLAMEYGSLAAAAIVAGRQCGDFSAARYQRALEHSWLGEKLRHLHRSTRLFYGPTRWLWFALAERSRRLRAVGLRWYNGVDQWDRLSPWQALAAVLANRAGA